MLQGKREHPEQQQRVYLGGLHVFIWVEVGTVTHSSTLARRTAWTEEAGGLQSMGLQRAGHD